MNKLDNSKTIHLYQAKLLEKIQASILKYIVSVGNHFHLIRNILHITANFKSKIYKIYKRNSLKHGFDSVNDAFDTTTTMQYKEIKQEK